jgi:hypothetical protein
MCEIADVCTSIVTCTRAAERMSHVFVTLVVLQVTVGHARGGKHKFLGMTLYINVVMKIKVMGPSLLPMHLPPADTCLPSCCPVCAREITVKNKLMLPDFIRVFMFQRM